MKAQYTVGVIGGGSWGTALAILANRAGSKVCLTTRNTNVLDTIRHERENVIYLPGIYIDPSIEITNSVADTCQSEILILAVPSHCMRSACIALSDTLPSTTTLVLGSKGVERGSLLYMSEVVETVLPNNPVAVLSGPNFAREAAEGHPTATTIACRDAELGEMLIYAIGGKYFRPYLTEDIMGTQTGGAVKNVIAVACGIAAGCGMGENARAAIITRGFAEMTRLALAKGGRVETLAGLSGLGDMILTCTSTTSRNMAFGMSLAKRTTPLDITVADGRGVVEGVMAAESVCRLAKKHQISMPICEAVHRVLANQISVDEAVAALLERPFVAEGLGRPRPLSG